jgi:hypothetical protein
MKQRTLDILDKELSRTNDYYSKLTDEVRFRFLREEFLLDQFYWDKYFPEINKFSYSWQEFKYTDISQPDALDQLIPTDDIGVYLFVVKAENLFLGMPVYVFYVGISGEKGSERPLRERLKDYFRYNQLKKRKQVHRLLSMYYKNVYVKYSIMKISNKLLEQLEVDLHGFYYPICNERDFPVKLKELRNAF